MSRMILAATTPVMLSWIETRMLANRKKENVLVLRISMFFIIAATAAAAAARYAVRREDGR